MKLPSVDDLYEAIQDACLPGLWSKGVAFARAGAVILESASDDEIAVRVQIKDRPTSPKVQLWPDDDDWFCDCGDRGDACAHVAAAVIAAKNGQIAERGEASATRLATGAGAPFVRYRFTRTPAGLSFDRFVVRGDQEEALNGSLVSLVGGISSGRVDSVRLVTSKEDFAIDSVLLAKKRGVLDKPQLRQLLAVLKDCANVELDRKAVRISGSVVSTRVIVSDEGAGFKLEVAGDATVTETFINGAALCGDLLRPLAESPVTPRQFNAREAASFVAEALPELQKKCVVDIRTTRLPELRDERPRVLLKLEDLAGGSLAVVPRIVYGDPPFAEAMGERLELLNPRLAPRRDRESERQLIRKLQTTLHLAPGQMTRFEGAAAVSFRNSLDGWDIEGRGKERFEVKGKVAAQLEIGERGFGLSFSTGSTGTPGAQASAEQVFKAWREGSDYVSLTGGGFATIPKDWLEKHGETLAALLAARDAQGKLPSHLLPSLAAVGEELGARLPDPLVKLRAALDRFEGIREAPLPNDLKAELRGYQRAGVNWLCFLRDSGMGAMLADDMGLGKTLQALCALKGRSLIVAPTSVLYGWAEQLTRFRPGLSFSIYHGANRALDEKADVILTTYSILRLDRDALGAWEWDTVVLDEAQIIKNPDSQVAQAAQALPGKFKVALSGTPIENRVEDLWSQFQFLNPGLLGTRERFVEGLGREPRRLREKIRPFILRRLKRDVAPELPARTEVTLHCELSEQERGLYETVLASTRQDLVARLGAEANVIQLLEALLRLRQACCHPGLVPGQAAATSSKVELLLESLEESIALGHRALIFSQWTSYLDLIEPQLKARAISFTRLDGSTPNRQEIVADFQRDDGPRAMLLSLKAGGVGLNLTAADHVYLLDPWWNPSVEEQAADRAHRIGQKNPVIVHRLIAKDTVEEKIQALQKSKLALAGQVLEDSAAALNLTRADLMQLLA